MGENLGSLQVSSLYKDFLDASFGGQFMEVNYIDTQLIWKDTLTEFVGTPVEAIKKPIIMKDSSGNRITPQTSPTMRNPAIRAPGTEIPKIGMDDYTFETEGLVPYHIGFDIDEDKLNDDTPINRRALVDQYSKLGLSWTKFLNDEVLAAAFESFSYTVDGSTTLADYMDHSANMSYENTSGFLCGKLDADYYWNGDNASYLVDITNLQTTGAVQTGYPANFDSMAMHMTVLEDIVLWGQSNKYSWELSPLGNGRKISSIQGMDIVGLNNVDGLTSTNYDKVMFFDSRYRPCVTHYHTKAWKGWTRWGQDAKIQTAVQDYGPDQGGRQAVLTRGAFRTIIQPYHEFFYGLLEVY